jgi:hypothetical protein
MFCCFPKTRYAYKEALEAKVRSLEDSLEEILQMNNDLAEYSNQTVTRYTNAVIRNRRLEEMVSAQRDDIVALNQLLFIPVKDECTQTE